MSKHFSALRRSLRTLVGGRRAKRAADLRHRFRSIERLEERALLTTTVFVDFGEGLNRVLYTTVGELRRDLIGPDVRRGAGFAADNEPLQILPLFTIFQQQQIDYNDDGRLGDATDYALFRSDVIATLQREFAPFDINVQVAAAGGTREMVAAMQRNAGDPTGQFDAYVLAASIFTVNPRNPRGLEDGWLGIASGVDLVQNRRNLTDEAVVLDGQFILNTAQASNWNLATSFANIVAHEAGHTFGLEHTSNGGTLPAMLTGDQDLLTSSDIMVEGGGSGNDLLNVSFFTRYPLMVGDGNSVQTDTRNSFLKLAQDPDIGLHNTGPQFITGTGAFDRITVTRVPLSNTVRVTVETFRDNTFDAAALINLSVPSYSYQFPLTSAGIVIDGGRSDDLVIVDALMGVPVTVRGGQGFDVLRLNGAAATDATFTPDTAVRLIPGNENYIGRTAIDDRRQFFSYSGSVFARTGNTLTSIRYEEFDDAGAVEFNTFGSLAFNGSAGSDVLSLNASTAGVAGATSNEVEGVVGNVPFPNMRFSNVRSVVIDAGASFANDSVSITSVNATGMAGLTVLTGAGNDFINFGTSNLQLAVPSGRIVLNFGSGADAVTAAGDSDWTISDFSLSTGLAGTGVVLQELAGESAYLMGGAGNNTFRASNWNGGGRLDGMDGMDVVEMTRDSHFSIGANFVNAFGGGGFLLNQVENIRLIGGPSNNAFFDYGWNGLATFDGAGGTGDMVVGVRDSNFRLTDTQYFAGDSAFTSTVTLTSVELASLNGGPSTNQFDVSARTTPAALNGGGGQDVLVHTRDADVTLTNNALTVTAARNNFFSLASIEYATLSGGAGPNAFTIAQWAGSGTLVGGGGNDTFNISQGSLDAVAGFWNIVGGAGDDRIFVNDNLGSGGNYLVGPNSVTMAPGAARRFGAVFFDGTSETLRLNANNGPNRIDVTPSIGTTFTIDGNLPSGPPGDTLVLHTAFTGAPNGPLNGPLPGQRRFTFNSGHRDVVFEDIEQLLGAQ
jgi:hypothetical protein